MADEQRADEGVANAMARKLKTFTTSAGFFDLAIAAPSMKAALDAWNAGRNLFRDGFAKVSTDPAVVATTTAQPGIVLRRPVGSNTPFSEQAALPENLPVGKRRRPAKVPVSKNAAPKNKAQPESRRSSDKRARKRERELERAEARRARAIAAAQAALDRASRAHKARVADIDKAWAALDRRRQADEARWRKAKRKLGDAVRAARS